MSCDRRADSYSTEDAQYSPELWSLFHVFKAFRNIETDRKQAGGEVVGLIWGFGFLVGIFFFFGLPPQIFATTEKTASA